MNPDWNAVIVALGVVLTGAQIAFASWWASRQLRAQLEWSRREAALNFSMVRNPALRESRMSLDRIFQGRFYACTPLSREDVARYIEEKKDDGFYTHMTTILSNWNVMAVAIRSGVADEDVAFEMIANSMLDSVDFFRSYIDLREEEHPLSYEHLLDLDKRWRARLETRTAPADFHEPFVAGEKRRGLVRSRLHPLTLLRQVRPVSMCMPPAAQGFGSNRTNVAPITDRK